MKSTHPDRRPLAFALVFATIAILVPVMANGLSAGLINYFPVVPQKWPPATATPSPGRILITEVLYDPTGDEPEGEWVEIANIGDLPFNLSGFKLGDEETQGEQEGMGQFPPDVNLAPGQVVVVAYRAVEFERIYDFWPDYEFVESDPFVPNLVKYASWAGGNVNLNNSGDEVLILNLSDERVDAVSWGSSPLGFDPPADGVAEGSSLERSPANIDSDSAMDWVEQVDPNPGVIDVRQPTATPTLSPTPYTLTATPTPPGKIPVLISEVLYDPLGDDPGGEWIELYHGGEIGVDLTGYRLGDEETIGGGEGMLVFPEGSYLPAGLTLVIANRAALFQIAYGFLPQYEIIDSDPTVPELDRDPLWATGSVNLSKDGDEVLFIDPVGAIVDAVSWGTSTFAFSPAILPVPEGSSIERYPPGMDTDSASDWRAQANPDPGAVDLTPPTPTPEPIIGLVINEIHADPDETEGDANGDGLVDVVDDEFIEIVNTSGIEVNLGGWSLLDGYGVRHIFPANSYLADQCSVVVFGGGSPLGTFGGSLVQVASQGTLGLNNSGDTITLLDISQDVAATYSYGSEGGDDQSLTRYPDITGPEPLVKHSTLVESGGARYSPGVRIDGSLFSGCGFSREEAAAKSRVDFGYLMLVLSWLGGLRIGTRWVDTVG